MMDQFRAYGDAARSVPQARVASADDKWYCSRRRSWRQGCRNRYCPRRSGGFPSDPAKEASPV